MLKKAMPALRNPQLAVFWYIIHLDSFIGDRGTVDEGIQSGSDIELDFCHEDRWALYSKGYNIQGYKYDQFPRGRITYNPAGCFFTVWCDEYIYNSPAVRRSLIHEYGLDGQKVHWRQCVDYERYLTKEDSDVVSVLSTNNIEKADNGSVQLRVGDTVRVIGTTICGNTENAECIPIGTICKVEEVARKDNKDYYGICRDSDDRHMPFWYTRDALEKGHMMWISEEGENKNVSTRCI